MRESDIRSARVKAELNLLMRSFIDKSNEMKILRPDGTAYEKAASIVHSMYLKQVSLHHELEQLGEQKITLAEKAFNF